LKKRLHSALATLLASSSIESTAAKRNKTTTNKTKTKHSRKKTIAKPKKKKLWKIIATTDNDLRCRVERWPSRRLKCAIPEHLPASFYIVVPQIQKDTYLLLSTNASLHLLQHLRK
jgi:hypothetical protein